MTILVLSKVSTTAAVVSAVATATAAVEASANTALVSVISLAITSITTILLAWIAFQQARLSRTVGTLEKNTNSIKDALVATTEKEALARGKSEGYETGHLDGRVEGIRETKRKDT